jgi:hypothetical protein
LTAHESGATFAVSRSIWTRKSVRHVLFFRPFAIVVKTLRDGRISFLEALRNAFPYPFR